MIVLCPVPPTGTSRAPGSWAAVGASGLQRSAHVAGAVEQQCGDCGQRAGLWRRRAGRRGPGLAQRGGPGLQRGLRVEGVERRVTERGHRLPSLGLARADRGGWRPGEAALGAGRGQQQGNAERARIGGQLDRVGDLLEAEQRPGVALPGRAQRRGELGEYRRQAQVAGDHQRQQPRAVDPQRLAPTVEADREARTRPALADPGDQRAQIFDRLRGDAPAQWRAQGRQHLACGGMVRASAVRAAGSDDGSSTRRVTSPGWASVVDARPSSPTTRRRSTAGVGRERRARRRRPRPSHASGSSRAGAQALRAGGDLRARVLGLVSSTSGRRSRRRRSPAGRTAAGRGRAARRRAGTGAGSGTAPAR